MATKKRQPNGKMQAWIDARQRHRLPHTQVQMARELGEAQKKEARRAARRQLATETP